jgi:hypothetical protein
VSFLNWHGYAADVLVTAIPLDAPLPRVAAAPGTVEAAYNNTEVRLEPLLIAADVWQLRLARASVAPGLWPTHPCRYTRGPNA